MSIDCGKRFEIVRKEHTKKSSSTYRQSKTYSVDYPSFQQALVLHDIFSLAELVRLCRSIEDVQQRAQSFVPPSTNYARILEPTLAYHKPRSISGISSIIDEPIPNMDQVPSQSCAPISAITCWNCQQAGHRSQNCTQPRRRHCYKCGTPDVIVHTCPKCSGNEQPRN